jgi:nucleolar complex protein 3
MHAPSYSSGALLAFVRQILHRYPTAAQLLENEQDIVTSGTYTPNAEDPDHTNPFATSAWELATLKFHINPSIKEHASEASMRKMLQLPREDPEKIHKELVRNRNECYVAQRFVKKRHPLDTTKGKKSGRRERKQVRFITPRDTDSYHLKKLVV